MTTSDPFGLGGDGLVFLLFFLSRKVAAQIQQGSSDRAAAEDVGPYFSVLYLSPSLCSLVCVCVCVWPAGASPSSWAVVLECVGGELRGSSAVRGRWCETVERQWGWRGGRIVRGSEGLGGGGPGRKGLRPGFQVWPCRVRTTARLPAPSTGGCRGSSCR